MSTESTEPRWYCLSHEGMATLCTDEEDAKEVAAESLALYPQNGPYRAVQMVAASAVALAKEAERAACLRACESVIAASMIGRGYAKGAELCMQAIQAMEMTR